MVCIYCGKEINNIGGFKKHVKICKNISIDIKNNIINEYKKGLSINKLHKKYKISKCVIINLIGDLKRTKSESGRIAHILYSNVFKHSKETKDKIRKKRIEYIKNHPENTAWRQKNLSYPELCFLNFLKAEKLNEKYNIIREFSVFPYYIDFAFPDIKLAIEIDGSQHLTEEHKVKDKKKDECLKLNGWLILRIEATSIMYELNNVKIHLYNILNNISNYDNKKLVIYSEIKKQKELKEIERNKIKAEKMKLKNDFIKQRKELILNSNINFSKYGWLTKVSKLLNISHTNVSEWMKKYMNDFYNTCFIRKKKMRL